MQYILSKQEYDELVNAKELAEEAVCAAFQVKIDQRLKVLRAEAREQFVAFAKAYPEASLDNPWGQKAPVKLLVDKMGELCDRFFRLTK